MRVIGRFGGAANGRMAATTRIVAAKLFSGTILGRGSSQLAISHRDRVGVHRNAAMSMAIIRQTAEQEHLANAAAVAAVAAIYLSCTQPDRYIFICVRLSAAQMELLFWPKRALHSVDAICLRSRNADGALKWSHSNAAGSSRPSA